MANNIVHCRICKQAIDKRSMKEGADYVMPTRNYYYHTKCYEDWGKKKNDVHADAADTVWFSSAWDYLRKELKMTLDFHKFKIQWGSFLKKGYTAKGIYFSLKYFYGIKKGDKAKAQGGIGIIPYVYTEATQYWVDREAKDSGILSRIEDQLKEKQSRKEVTYVTAKENKPKPLYDLADIMQMGDVE